MQKVASVADHFLIPQYASLEYCFEQLGFKLPKPGAQAAIMPDGSAVCIALLQSNFESKSSGWSLRYSQPAAKRIPYNLLGALWHCANKCAGQFSVVVVSWLELTAKDGKIIKILRPFAKHHLRMFLIDYADDGSFSAQGGHDWDVIVEAKKRRVFTASAAELKRAGITKAAPSTLVYRGVPTQAAAPKKPNRKGK